MEKKSLAVDAYVKAQMKTKKAVAPVKEFIAGQLAFHDSCRDTGRGNNATKTTQVVLIRSIEPGSKFGPNVAVVVLEDGDLAIVEVSSLRHFPEVFQGATL